MKGRLEVVVHPGGYIAIPDESLAPLVLLADADVEWVTLEEDPIINKASYIMLPQGDTPAVPPPLDPRQEISGRKRAHPDKKISSRGSSRPKTTTSSQRDRPSSHHKQSTSKMSGAPPPRPALERNDSVVELKRERSPSEEPEHEVISDGEHEPVEDDNDLHLLPIQPLAEALQHTVEKGVPSAAIKREPGEVFVKELLHLHQPSARGTWKFVNYEVSRDAIDCFANQSGFETEGVEHPSAAQVFRIRESTQYYFNTGQLQPLLPDTWNYHDPTLEIEFSYVGDEDRAAATGWTANKDELPPATFDFGVDPRTTLQHAPLNDGANDQRGVHGEANYYTRDIDGVTITLDRAMAVPSKPFQHHKIWIYKQRWQSYNGEVNWASKKSLDTLNKWRNQTLEREGWMLLRPQERPKYTAEQRTWLFKHIVLAKGGAPQEGYKQICEEFNKRFALVGEAMRNVSGILEVCKRLIKEYAENDGKQKPAVERREAKRPRMEGGMGENAAAGEEEMGDGEEVSEDGEESDDPVMDAFLLQYGDETDDFLRRFESVEEV